MLSEDSVYCLFRPFFGVDCDVCCAISFTVTDLPNRCKWKGTSMF